MGKNNKRASSDPRSNLFLGDAENLIIIDDKEHPLHDGSRLDKPLSPQFVASIKLRGVVEPVVVRKEEGKFIVVNGRRRVRGAREANKLRVAEGLKALPVPYIVKGPNDQEARRMRVELNMHLGYSLEEKLEIMQELLDANTPDTDVADSLEVTTGTIRNWKKLRNDCTKKVQAAVFDESVRLADAVQLASLDVAEQNEKLAKLVEQRPTRKTKKANKAAGKASAGSKAPAGPGARARLLLDHPDQLKDGEEILLKWIRGEASDGDFVAKLPRFAPALE